MAANRRLPIIIGGVSVGVVVVVVALIVMLRGPSLPASAEGRAVCKFVEEQAPSHKFEFVKWYEPREIAALEAAIVKEHEDNLKTMELMKGFDKPPPGVPADPQGQAQFQEMQAATKKMDADLKALRPLKFCRIKYRCLDKAGGSFVDRDEIYAVRGDRVMLAPGHLAMSYNSQYQD